MAGINKVILVGALGQDPVTNATATKVSIATSESWKDKSTGQTTEKTEWHRVVFFNRLAEVAAQYLVKGSKIYIEGSLRTSKWTDKEGLDRYTTEIIASKLEMLSSKSDSESQAKPKSRYEVSRSESSSSSSEANFIDDDLPF